MPRSVPRSLFGLPEQPDPAPAGDGGSSDDLVSQLGDEIKVTIDKWSVGQIGVSDLVSAVAVVAGGFVLAWIIRRLVRRASNRLEGAARTATSTLGQLAGGAVILLAVALALEIIGFGLGPILVLILILIVAVLLLRPMITNLSSGLLLQLRKAIDVGDLVTTTGGVFGTVNEITTRTVTIDTADGRRVHVPNSDVLNDAIVNHTTRGGRRSSFEVTVRADVDLELAFATIRSAVSGLDEIRADPEPEVQAARLIGRLVVIRVLVWHGPAQSETRAAVDAGIRAVIADLAAVGISLDGPTLVELQSESTDARNT